MNSIDNKSKGGRYRLFHDPVSEYTNNASKKIIDILRDLPTHTVISLEELAARLKLSIEETKTELEKVIKVLPSYQKIEIGRPSIFSDGLNESFEKGYYLSDSKKNINC